MIISLQAAHVVMHGWQYWNRLFVYINTGENFRGF